MKSTITTRIEQTLIGHRSYIDKVRESTISNQYKNVSETSGETRRDVQLNYRFTPGRRGNMRREEEPLRSEEISYCSEVFEEVLFRPEGTLIHQDGSSASRSGAIGGSPYVGFYVNKEALMRLAERDAGLSDVADCVSTLQVDEEIIKHIIKNYEAPGFASFSLLLGIWTQYILASGIASKGEHRLAVMAMQGLEKYSYSYRRGVVYAAKAMKTRTLVLTSDSDGDNESCGLSGDTVYRESNDWNLLCTAQNLASKRRVQIKMELASAFQNLAVEVTQALRILSSEVGTQERRTRGRPTRAEQERRDSVSARFREIGGVEYQNDTRLYLGSATDDDFAEVMPSVGNNTTTQNEIEEDTSVPCAPMYAELLPGTGHAFFHSIEPQINFEDYDCLVEIYSAGASVALNSPPTIPSIVVPLNQTVGRMIRQAAMCASQMIGQENFDLDSLRSEPMSVTAFALLPMIAGLSERIEFSPDDSGQFKFSGTRSPELFRSSLEQVVRAVDRTTASEIRLETLSVKAATPFGSRMLVTLNLSSDVTASLKQSAILHLREEIIPYNKIKTLVVTSDQKISLAAIGLTGTGSAIQTLQGQWVLVANDLKVIAAAAESNFKSEHKSRVKEVSLGIVLPATEKKQKKSNA